MIDYFESAECSDIGQVRKTNEDSCLRLPRVGVYCVADGMGGAAGGDLASETITTTLRQAFGDAPLARRGTLADYVSLVDEAADRASRWIKNFADEKLIGQMGSTIVAIVFDPANPRRAVGLHAGDSRLYRCRNGELTLLTTDHTAVAALAAKSGRDPASLPARYHNELLRAVGLKASVRLERTELDVRASDVFLLCSDGLSRMLTDSAMAKILDDGAGKELALVARELVNQANRAGGRDNISVVLVRVGDITRIPAAEETEKTDSVTVAASTEQETIHKPPGSFPVEDPGTSPPGTGLQTSDGTPAPANHDKHSASPIEGSFELKPTGHKFISLKVLLWLASIAVTGVAVWLYPEISRGVRSGAFRAHVQPLGGAKPTQEENETAEGVASANPNQTMGSKLSPKKVETASAVENREADAELQRFDLQFERLLVQFNVLRPEDPYIRSAEARLEKTLDGGNADQHREDYLRTVARLENEYQKGGWLRLRDRWKYIAV